MSAALDQAFETQRLRLVETVTRTAVATWDRTFHEREAATAQMVQLVEAGTGQMAALVDAYMTASLREAGENVALQGEAGGGYTVQELRGVPGDAVYDRPFGAIGGQLEEGAEFAVAMEASRERLRREIRTDLQLAQVKAAQALVTGDNGIAGWRRQVVGTCAYCAAHNDEYRGEDPMPIHQNCRCGVAPVIQDRKITNRTESVKDDELGHVLDKSEPLVEPEVKTIDDLVTSYGRGGRVEAYRVGSTQDPGRGVFFGESAESIASYVGLHGDAAITRYVLDVKKVAVFDDVHDAYRQTFGKSLNDAIDAYERRNRAKNVTRVEAFRAMEAKLAAKLRSQGYDAIVYRKTDIGRELAIISKKKIVNLA